MRTADNDRFDRLRIPDLAECAYDIHANRLLRIVQDPDQSVDRLSRPGLSEARRGTRPDVRVVAPEILEDPLRLTRAPRN